MLNAEQSQVLNAEQSPAPMEVEVPPVASAPNTSDLDSVADSAPVTKLIQLLLQDFFLIRLAEHHIWEDLKISCNK